jgi:2-polyprenyl-6-methoxyphenol hydroxylase-like FAD-dependent oxidoreductase
MSNDQYDVIVVGARCAGSPTAMLLARKGYRVLLVDRATFPSDTISTHLIHPPGVSALRRWGLLDRVIASNCPPIHTYSFDLGPFAHTGTPGLADEPVSYAPRRTVLDSLLVDAAADAGAEVRESFTVGEVVIENGRVTGIRGHGYGGTTVTERARVVIGADGLHSIVARAVNAEQYNEKPRLEASYYTYWSGLPMDGRFEGYDRGTRAMAAWPTNDDLTLLIVGWPITEFEANRKSVEEHYLAGVAMAPELHERVRDAKRAERFYGAAVPNFFRKPFGPGWALVGDAGYNKDFITAQGISDAFRQAELCTRALDASFSGASDFDTAMQSYQTARDERAFPTYEFTTQFASFTPPSPELQQLHMAINGNQEAMNGFVRVFSGVVSPADFFSEENVGRIMAAAASAQSASA